MRPVLRHHRTDVRCGLLRVMSDHRDLPMAPAGCTLDDSGLGQQLDRYRRLGETPVSI